MGGVEDRGCRRACDRLSEWQRGKSDNNDDDDGGDGGGGDSGGSDDVWQLDGAGSGSAL